MKYRRFRESHLADFESLGLPLQESVDKTNARQNVRLSGLYALYISYKDKAATKVARGDKNLACCCPGVAFATLCHPMATGLVESRSFKPNPSFSCSNVVGHRLCWRSGEILCPIISSILDIVVWTTKF